METSFFNYRVKSLTGGEIALSKYKGKVVLVVNVASKCGYTPQYSELQTLYRKYEQKGLIVMGFPSNDFGKQEPGDSEEIAKFCKLNYGVGFPLFAKNAVTGKDKQPVYQFLTLSSSFKGEVAWNFEKFIVGKDGLVKARFKSSVKPLSEELVKKIEEQL